MIAGRFRPRGRLAVHRSGSTSTRSTADHCWVDIEDVQHLVDEATAPAVARVFASAGGHPLTAHLTVTDTIHTPEQAHARCMAALDRHPTAITPRHYVICRTAPSDPADPAPSPRPWPPAPAAPETTRPVRPSPDPVT
jgi:hypothetical protein